MYKVKVNEILIQLLYVLSLGIVAGQIFKIYQLTSVFFALTYVIVLALYLANIFKKFSKKDLIVLLIIIYSFINILIVSNTSDVEYLKKWLMFSFCLLYFSAISRISISTKLVNKILNYNVISICIFFVAFILMKGSIYYYTNTGVSYLTYGFYNPNVTALFITVLTIGTLMKFINNSKIEKKVLFALIIVLMFHLIMETKSRTSLIIYLSFLCVMIIYLIKGKLWIPKNKMLILIAASFPIIFVWIYLVTIEMVSEISILNFLVSEGKGLDSRVFIWESALNLVYKSPIFGIYSELGKSISHAQMHNSHMDVLASYGVIVLVLLIKFLYDVLIQMSKESLNSFQKLAWWGFVCSLSLGIGEAALFSGGLSFYLLVGQFILFVNCKKECGDKGK